MFATGRGYAGAWSRARAFAYDALALALYLAVLLCAAAAVHAYAPAVAERLATAETGHLAGLLSFTLPAVLCFAFLEASPAQATWGKRRCGLRLAAVDGRRVRLLQALWRNVLKFAPWEIAHGCAWRLWYGASATGPWVQAGLILVAALAAANLACAALTPRRQALYDLLSGTLVVRGRG